MGHPLHWSQIECRSFHVCRHHAAAHRVRRAVAGQRAGCWPCRTHAQRHPRMPNATPSSRPMPPPSRAVTAGAAWPPACATTRCIRTCRPRRCSTISSKSIAPPWRRTCSNTPTGSRPPTCAARSCWNWHDARTGTASARCTSPAWATRLPATPCAHAWPAAARWISSATWPHCGPSRTCPVPAITVLAAAHDQGLLTDARLWTRIDRAADAGEAGTVASLAGWLPADPIVTIAQQLALALRDPAAALAEAASWPDNTRQRQAATLALTAAGPAPDRQRRSGVAKTAVPLQLQRRPAQPDPADPGAVPRHRFRRPRAGPADRAARRRTNRRTREWRVRVALARQDWNAVLAGIDAMPAGQQQDGEWQYFRGRALAALGRDDEARQQLDAQAGTTTFFGFLSADRLDQPYAICPLDPGRRPATRAGPAGHSRPAACVRTVRRGPAQAGPARMDPRIAGRRRRHRADCRRHGQPSRLVRPRRVRHEQRRSTAPV